jgi:membrane protein YfhO
MESRRSTIASVILLLILALAMFGDLLFVDGTRVLGHPGSDMFLQYFAWREFGFRELAKGNLALWNPHIFSGAPYFGGMQGALLYPPNWLFLFLPTPVAINWTVALHVFAIGALMFFWMRQRNLSAAAGFFAGTLVMFCGAFFPHIFAGHLPQLSAMTWSPLIFCSIEAIFRTQRGRWSLLGMLAVAMQILAGFPQYVFYTGIIAGLYAALRLIRHWTWRLAAALLSIYPGGALLAAVQLLPAIQTTRETTRGFRLPFQFASMLGLPPENFVTLLAPDFFGQMAKYWGRWYLWETSLFIGVAGLAFAIYAAIWCERTIKWRPLIVVFVSLLLALGAYTPLFSFLYNWVPGFDRFRSISKFSFLASLFLCLLAATGLERLFRQKRIETSFIAAVFAAAISLGVAGWWAARTASWEGLINASRASGQSYLFPQLYASAEFISQSQHRAAMSLFVAAGVCALLGIILTFATRELRALFGVIALGIAETFVFASGTRVTFDSATIVNPYEKRFLEEHPDDYRVMNVANPNSAMLIGAQDMWGYEATVVRRYAEFMTWSQGNDPDQPMSYVRFVRYDPLFAMLRLRYVFGQHRTEVEIGDAPEAPMSHLHLISSYRVLPDRNAVFNALRSVTFDPAREVILESEPEPKPSPAESAGTVRIVTASTDALEIEADVEQPSILLITDSFTPSWRAVALPGSVQPNYKLHPANYILRAVPLIAGHHHLRVEYARDALAIGGCISILASVAFLAALAWRWKNRLK